MSQITVEQITQIWTEILRQGPDPIQSLFDLDTNSLSFFRFLADLKTRHGVDLDFAELMSAQTIVGIVELINARNVKIRHALVQTAALA